MARSTFTIAAFAAAAVLALPASAQQASKTVRQATSGGAVAVGSNNGNGNGYQVESGCAAAADAGSGMLGSTPTC